MIGYLHPDKYAQVYLFVIRMLQLTPEVHIMACRLFGDKQLSYQC